MCEPTTITLAVGAVLSSAVSVYSAQTKKAEAKYQSALAVQQAEKAKTDAAYERQTGIEEARAQRLQAILNMGEEKANIAAGNISTNSQTALNIVDDAKLNGELEALNTLRESEKRANDYMFSSENYYSQAALTSFSANRNYTSSIFSTISSGIISNKTGISKLSEIGIS